MAQVQEVSKEGLKHQFVIKVPHDVVNQNWLNKLEEIGKSAKIAGFRPGKIPMPVLQQHYGAGARAEVLDQTVSEATEKALTDRNMRPAMQPKIELVSFAEGKDVEFKIDVEVLPEVPEADFSKIKLERQVAEVSDKAVDEAIARAAKAMREPVAVTDKRAAQKGDVLVIDFDGRVDGKARDGMKGAAHRLELGSQSFIDTFEDQLVGSKVGDKKLVKVTFPKDYHATDLAGKAAEFDVEVKELLAHKPAEMNDELAKEIGFPSIEELRKRVRDDIAGNYGRISRTALKRKLMDQLADMCTFAIPQGMLEVEFGSIWQQIEQAKKAGQLSKEDEGKSDEVLKKEYRAIAERRIRLGLLLAEIAQKQKVNVESNELRNALMAEARRFPGQEKAVFEYYTKTEGALERLRAPILEEKVIDYIITQCKITDKTISAEELLKLPEDDE